LVQGTESGDRGIRVGGGLKIGQEVARAKAPREAADSFVDLVRNGHAREAAAGAEAAVVAKDAATDGDGAINVGAGEAGVDADFVDQVAEPLPKVKVVTVVGESGRLPGGRGRLASSVC